jgi:L-fuculose-phosphate aldolase
MVAASKAGFAAPAGVNSKSSRNKIEEFFNSSPMRTLKEQICEIGRRMWRRAYVEGNGGNLGLKVACDLVLCTPTLISKGFMTPADLCLVDMAGNQLAGEKKATSEISMHLQIMQLQPRATATVHCHPPNATGFAIAGMLPPTCILPEYELFSSVAMAPYRTPGTAEMGKVVAELADQHNTILMANHGVVAWSHLDIEDAYFKIEIIESYCQTLLVVSQLGKPANTLNHEQVRELLKLKQSRGIPDPRYEAKEFE